MAPERPEDSRWPAAATTPGLRAISSVVAGRLIGRFFWFGSLIVLAALVSPGAFGSIAIGLVILDGATRITEAGTRGALVLAVNVTARDLHRALIRNMLIGTALAIGMALAAGPVIRVFAEGGDPTVVRALSPAIVIYAASILPMALLARHLAFQRRAAVEAGTMIPASLIAVVAGVLGADAWALVLRQLVCYALMAALAWVAARDLFPRAATTTTEDGDGRRARNWSRRPFLLFALSHYVVFNLDYLIVGALTDARSLGLYALAFRLSFTAVLELSHVMGIVIFPLAAASDLATVRRRAVTALRLASFVLLPVIPAVVALAPVVIPEAFGQDWNGAVRPFQILVVVGVAHTILNMLGESIAGAGHMDFRVRVNLVWMVGMAIALLVFVGAWGIVGAALAHLALYIPVVAVYAIWGTRLLRLTPREIGIALRPVVVAVAVQSAVTWAAILLLHQWTSYSVAATTGALLGLTFTALLLLSSAKRRI